MSNVDENQSQMQITVGDRLQSVACEAQVIVIRAPAEPVSLTCGGAPMVRIDAQSQATTPPGSGAGGALALGKRYTDEDGGLELLIMRAGNGPLELNGSPLEIKPPKPLPSSD